METDRKLRTGHKLFPFYPFLLIPFPQMSKFWKILLRFYFSLTLILHDFPLDNEGKAIFHISKLEVLKDNVQIWGGNPVFLQMHLNHRFYNGKAKILILLYSGFSEYPA